MNKRDRPLTLAGLRSFAAAARHLSITRAAAEMHLSQPALSRQIQSLEEELGRTLFTRTTRRIDLTLAGRSLARAIEAGLRQIDDCVDQLRTAELRARISVTTFASFASLWLIPKLARFSREHPQVDVNCIATDRLVDLARDNIDVALRCSSKAIAEPDGIFLFDEFLVPVCSPALLAAGPELRRPDDLRHQTLLRNDEEMEVVFPWLSWESWAEELGLPKLAMRSALRFTNHDQVIQAALSGQGVALARGPLAADLLASGRLVSPFPAIRRTEYRYYAVTNAASRKRPEVAAFIDWIRSEVANAPRSPSVSAD